MYPSCGRHSENYNATKIVFTAVSTQLNDNASQYIVQCLMVLTGFHVPTIPNVSFFLSRLEQGQHSCQQPLTFFPNQQKIQQNTSSSGVMGLRTL